VSNTVAVVAAISLTVGSVVATSTGQQVALPGAVGVAADEVAVGDAEPRAGGLLLADEFVLGGERRAVGPHRLELAQRGAEVALAEQVLDARQRGLGPVGLGDRLQRRGVWVDERVAHGRGDARATERGGLHGRVAAAAIASLRLRHLCASLSLSERPIRARVDAGYSRPASS
jgi:hypothetical protein